MLDTILHTPRLILRPFKWSDTDDFYEYARTDRVGPMAGWQPHESRWRTRSVINAFNRLGNVLALELREGGKVIGSVGLHPDERRAGVNARMLGYALNPDYWGGGYAAEAGRAVLAFAFEKAGLSLVSAYCYAENRRSSAVLEKLGFTYEGMLRSSYLLYDGTLHDSLCFSILREEYAQK